MKKVIFLFGVIATLFFSAPANAGSDDTLLFDLGYVEDDVYYNDFFEFEVPIPKNWEYKLDTEQKIMKKAIKEVYSKDNQLRQYIDPEEIETAILLILTREYEYGSTFSPSVVLLIENISESPIRTGAQYLDASARGLKISNPKVKISKDPYGQHDFGGKKFYSMHTKSKVGNIKLNQTFFSTIIGDFAFSALGTYVDKTDLPELIEIFEKFRFGK